MSDGENETRALLLFGDATVHVIDDYDNRPSLFSRGLPAARAPDEIIDLVEQYWRLPFSDDGLIAGLIADWLGDNEDALVPLRYGDKLRACVADARESMLAIYNDPGRRRTE